jgi:hypothetical protein
MYSGESREAPLHGSPTHEKDAWLVFDVGNNPNDFHIGIIRLRPTVLQAFSNLVLAWEVSASQILTDDRHGWRSWSIATVKRAAAQ